MNGLKRSGIEVNRKVLADLAVRDATAFGELVRTAKASLS
jgi:large subunit ribosomal protein L20